MSQCTKANFEGTKRSETKRTSSFVRRIRNICYLFVMQLFFVWVYCSNGAWFLFLLTFEYTKIRGMLGNDKLCKPKLHIAFEL